MVDRRVLWADMKSLAPAIGDAPWLQLGDLNVVRRLLERLVGFDNSASLEFNSCLDDICMDDMPFKGLWFTWSNKRGGLGNIKSKMDRVLVNGSWLDAFLKNQRLFFWLLEYQITALFCDKGSALCFWTQKHEFDDIPEVIARRLSPDWALWMASDLIGIAETNSEKTLAYLLPAMVHVSAQPQIIKRVSTKLCSCSKQSLRSLNNNLLLQSLELP
ncbi:hypothetical protein RHGRI_024426 [Rhododendron griersonianum]|uniref:Uncharacterized protein n=1 Tax=Rhododendron griersonianum TaxID=479676 RepID=A0AAV6JAY7_9ERIC|nr:hypothetical protein RHGRI_024426 [Rhododendron griersonianum]